MPIVPDTKDWTWVLEHRCGECGFDASMFPTEGVASLIRENAAAWKRVLTRHGGSVPLDERPSEDRWSILEYGCHVRDVLHLYEERLRLLLAEDDPIFPNWDQDAAAIEQRYNEQEPATVARELTQAASVIAASFDRVAGSQWQRTGMRSDGARFTVDTFARYMVHDPVHHLWDVDPTPTSTPPATDPPEPEFAVEADVELFPQKGGWHYVPVPQSISADLELFAERGLIPITARIGETIWDTSLLPKGDGTHFVALNAQVRKKENITVGDRVTVAFSRRERHRA